MTIREGWYFLGWAKPRSEGVVWH